MPRYDFLCKSCQKEFTVTLHMADLGKREVPCPHCGSKETKRQIEMFSAVTSKKS